MAAIVNARDVLLQAAATRYVAPALSGTLDFDSVTGAHKPANNATLGATWGVNIGSQPTNLSGINSTEGSKLSGIASGADVTSTILSSSGTSIVMSNASLFKSSTGLSGVFIGSGGLVGKDSGGNTTFSIDGATGAAMFKGNVSGNSNIDIGGSARFSGTTTANAQNWTVTVNDALNPRGGVYAYGSTVGLSGASSSGIGVNGFVTGGGVAVKADAASGGGTALQVVGGGMSLDNHAFTWNGQTYTAPSGNQAVLTAMGWWAFGNGSNQLTISNGTVCTNLNADMLDGLHASSFLGVNAQAVDSAQLAGYGVGNFARITGSGMGAPTPNAYLVLTNGSVTVTVPATI